MPWTENPLTRQRQRPPARYHRLKRAIGRTKATKSSPTSAARVQTLKTRVPASIPSPPHAYVRGDHTSERISITLRWMFTANI
jgi:hypothetical protein